MIDSIQELVSFPIMLFLHMLLFFLLGTSVVAIPLLPDYKDQKHYDRVQDQRPLLFPHLLRSLPTGLRWFYRIPKGDANQGSEGVDERFINDVFEIHHDGSITFHQLNEKPGEGLRGTPHPDVLNALNSERILDDWRPMLSSDVPFDDRSNQVTFYYGSRREIECYYGYVRTTALKLSNGIDGKPAGPPPIGFEGTWGRLPPELLPMHKEGHYDVIVLDNKSNPKLYTLTNKPGEMRFVTASVSEERLVGIWRRMPGVSNLLLQFSSLLLDFTGFRSLSSA
ncbi:hypothetical protein F5887DRAFT_988827 [Amanita rubescens]|nr:hypothetical protein F5887DRAFT_988827 [Amanita rubescens]